ncbi:MAG: hypothetical protein SFX73_39735 [Kofleriaceae bacterium]|nr:hypothetical protein [Kofleriaceae bacterium]
MRFRTIALGAALAAALFSTSGAVVRPKGAEEPMVTPDRAPRTHRTIAWSRASQLAAAGLPGWTAMWDRDTDVPVRLWGPGVHAPGAVADAAIAEAAAQQFLARHIQLLAPGASASDFVVVANELGAEGDVRSIGFQQYVRGVRVVGGSIGFSFKRDRMISVGSTALPNVTVDTTPRSVDVTRAAASAIGWLGNAGHKVAARSFAPERVILPVIRPRGPGGVDIRYRLADQLSVEATTSAGRWDVWVDATSHAPLARKSTIFFASGRVLYDVPDRAPTMTRSPKPAPLVNHLVDNMSKLATADGMISWEGAAPATVGPGLRGPLISVSNRGGSLVTGTVELEDGGEVVWSRAESELDDAQLSAFVFASTAKDYAKTHLNEQLAWLGDTLSVSVNENDTCNAYSTGDDIHFYKASTGTPSPFNPTCQNTARLSDVVYHEFGHSLHANSIIEGVGQFDGALSEGMSDMFAAFITKDHGMGRGFFLSDSPLRDLDPEGREKRWPEDTTGEVHNDGEIIGGTFWDLRTALIERHGEEQGDQIARKIYYGTLQRAADIPTTFIEALVSDDDDGDLTNGTPNQCEINAAFGAHGLADPQITLGLTPPVRDGYTITVKTKPPASVAGCTPVGVTSAKVAWKLRGGATQTLDLVPDGTTFSAAIPEQPDGSVIEYRVTIEMSDGAKLVYPNNVADTMYQMYVGPVENLWCADFENGLGEWTHGASPATRDEWEVGAPMGLGGDPAVAHGGTNVLGIDLTDDGVYRRSITTFAQSPVIDLASAFEGGAQPQIRLQYYRWLGVEDGFFDRAHIQVNGAKVWSSYASQSDAAGYNHVDREWRFHDIDITAQAQTGAVDLRFELASDAGFNLGGWTIDDVCVVKIAGPACTPGEEGCEEEQDVISDNGCCSIGGSPQGAAGLSLLTLGLVLRRRRRR